VMLLLTGGLAGLTTLWLIAAEQRNLAEMNFGQAAEQRNRAETSFWQAKQAVDDFYTRVSEDKLLRRDDAQGLRKELLGQALTFYQNFLRQRGHAPALEYEVAMTYYRIAVIHRELAAIAEAEAADLRACALFEKLVVNHPDDVKILSALAGTYANLGVLYYHHKRQPAEALRRFEGALAVAERLTDKELAPDAARRRALLLTNIYMNIGGIKRDTGPLPEAFEYYQKVQDIVTELARKDADDPQSLEVTAKFYCEQGTLLAYVGRMEEALQTLVKAYAAQDKLIARDPGLAKHQVVRAQIAGNIAYVQSNRGQVGETLRWYEQARGDWKELADRNPRVPQYRGGLARTCYRLGLVRRQFLPSGVEALHAFEEARVTLEGLAAEYPRVWDWQSLLASTHHEIGTIFGTIYRQSPPPL